MQNNLKFEANDIYNLPSARNTKGALYIQQELRFHLFPLFYSNKSKQIRVGRQKKQRRLRNPSTLNHHPSMHDILPPPVALVSSIHLISSANSYNQISD
jgi:hypothetical protein